MSNSNSATPRFSAERREDLHRLGVIDAQIDALEAILPGCRVLTRDSPRLQDVREELQAVASAISATVKSISLLEQADRKSAPARFEALNRMQKASYEGGGDLDEEVRAARDALCALHRAACKAIDELGNKQRRSNSAAARPIELIHDALTRGWVNGARGPIKRFNIPVSLDPKSAFREIVIICYETMTGKPGHDPERAIRRYKTRLRHQRDREDRQRDEVGIPPEYRKRRRQGA